MDIDVITPSFICKDGRLPDGAKLLYGLIFTLCMSGEACSESTARLAEEMRSKPRTIQSWLEKLEKCGYILREINRNAAKTGDPQRIIRIASFPPRKK